MAAPGGEEVTEQQEDSDRRQTGLGGEENRQEEEQRKRNEDFLDTFWKDLEAGVGTHAESTTSGGDGLHARGVLDPNPEAPPPTESARGDTSQEGHPGGRVGERTPSVQHPTLPGVPGGAQECTDRPRRVVSTLDQEELDDWQQEWRRRIKKKAGTTGWILYV